ncbi:MAG TPA: hypothetical protein VF759_07730 [Allosphingosinicella sp.]
MIAKGFKSVIWVATVGGAALGCYMVSLRVATERNELARVEMQIVEARRDIRSLQTELGTRGRMAQLEQWNAEVLALSAPSSAQFLKDEFTLARLYRNDPTVAERSAEVRLASAEAPVSKPAEAPKASAPAVVQAVAEPPAAQPPLVHRASFTTAEPVEKPKAKPAPRQKSAVPEPDSPAATAAKPAKPAPQRIASAATARREPSQTRPAVKPAAKPAGASAKPAAASAKPAAASAKPAGGSAKPAVVAAKPAREPAAGARDSRGNGGGGD